MPHGVVERLFESPLVVASTSFPRQIRESNEPGDQTGDGPVRLHSWLRIRTGKFSSTPHSQGGCRGCTPAEGVEGFIWTGSVCPDMPVRALRGTCVSKRV